MISPEKQRTWSARPAWSVLAGVFAAAGIRGPRRHQRGTPSYSRCRRR